MYIDVNKPKVKYIKNSDKTITYENQRYASTRLGKKGEETHMLPSIHKRNASDLGYKGAEQIASAKTRDQSQNSK